MLAEQGLLIETKSASLETMTVTIQALHVSGKQMTLSVFRQLPELIERVTDYKLWGYVRCVAPSSQAHSPIYRSLWLIVSAQGMLYRMRITAEPENLPQLFISV